MRSPWYGDWLGNGLVLSGLVSAGIGTGFLLEADRHAEAANSAGNYGTSASEARLASSQRVIGGASLGAGGVLIAAGIVRYLLLPDASSVTVSCAASADGFAVAIGGAF